uniref:class I SAM-dependent DNA methyltransferase n=1 Tax=Pedobacter schmidteae TaxID=2201271 RepID=UPI000EAE15A2|nr:class I SAM-dependent methyltransferase [Pedobacter schmidteae]
MNNRENVFEVYNKIAGWYDENRYRGLLEKDYLDKLLSFLEPGATVLDIGCGTGMPILNYLQTQGLKVVGVDASFKMLDIAIQNFPATRFVLADMRYLALKEQFDAVIAWDSFFHLQTADQPVMFEIFKKHLKPKGILLFTSGTEHGEAWGMNGGENLFHASLSTEAYAALLEENGFKVLKHKVNDPNCGNATVWMAQLKEL